MGLGLVIGGNKKPMRKFTFVWRVWFARLLKTNCCGCASLLFRSVHKKFAINNLPKPTHYCYPLGDLIYSTNQKLLVKHLGKILLLPVTLRNTNKGQCWWRNNFRGRMISWRPGFESAGPLAFSLLLSFFKFCCLGSFLSESGSRSRYLVFDIFQKNAYKAGPSL